MLDGGRRRVAGTCSQALARTSAATRRRGACGAPLVRGRARSRNNAAESNARVAAVKDRPVRRVAPRGVSRRAHRVPAETARTDLQSATTRPVVDGSPGLDVHQPSRKSCGKWRGAARSNRAPARVLARRASRSDVCGRGLRRRGVPVVPEVRSKRATSFGPGMSPSIEHSYGRGSSTPYLSARSARAAPRSVASGPMGRRSLPATCREWRWRHLAQGCR
jgi:hypothetical protein